MIIEYTAFGKTRKVKATPHNMTPTEVYDEVLLVERNEDMYALSSPRLRGKKVAIVTREDWLRAVDI